MESQIFVDGSEAIQETLNESEQVERVIADLKSMRVDPSDVSNTEFKAVLLCDSDLRRFGITAKTSSNTSSVWLFTILDDFNAAAVQIMTGPTIDDLEKQVRQSYGELQDPLLTSINIRPQDERYGGVPIGVSHRALRVEHHPRAICQNDGIELVKAMALAKISGYSTVHIFDLDSMKDERLRSLIMRMSRRKHEAIAIDGSYWLERPRITRNLASKSKRRRYDNRVIVFYDRDKARAKADEVNQNAKEKELRQNEEAERTARNRKEDRELVRCQIDMRQMLINHPEFPFSDTPTLKKELEPYQDSPFEFVLIARTLGLNIDFSSVETYPIAIAAHLRRIQRFTIPNEPAWHATKTFFEEEARRLGLSMEKPDGAA